MSLINGVVLSILVTVLGVAALWNPAQFRWIGDQTGYAPAQPFEFSHKIHAKDNSIPCEYCHSGARKGPVAGVPAGNVCMNCHSQVKGSTPEARQRIAGVVKAVQSGQPIPWVRIHRLPDFVRFDHSAHVAKGVACQTCHGPVETMSRVAQANHLSMGWCVSCHRSYTRRPPAGMKNVSAPAECSTCHY